MTDLLQGRTNEIILKHSQRAIVADITFSLGRESLVIFIRFGFIFFLFVTDVSATPLDVANKLLMDNAESIAGTVSNRINGISKTAEPSESSKDIATSDSRAFYCGGIAEVFRAMLIDKGLDAYIIDMAVGKATHVSVLVRYQGKHYVFDPTFRITLRNPVNFHHVAIEDALMLSDQQMRNLVFEVSMPLKRRLFEDYKQFLQVNDSFQDIKTPGSQVFYFRKVLDNGWVMAFRPGFTLNTYLQSVAPYLRAEGLRSTYDSYVKFYLYSVRGPSFSE